MEPEERRQKLLHVMPNEFETKSTQAVTKGNGTDGFEPVRQAVTYI
jgi:hypothetical protein